MTEPPSKEDLDDFIKANEVDDRAAADLRDCPPDVQRKVLDRGDLSSARNSSAALIVRIRDARVEARGGGGCRSGMGLPSSSEIEDYIKTNNIDDQAASALRSSSPTIKRLVLSSGAVSGGENPSASLLARIRDAKGGGGSIAVPSGPPGPSGAEIDAFLKANDVDDRAATDLREATPAIQRIVISRGDLRSARNPSSALLSRIRDAKMGVLGPLEGAPPLGYPGGFPAPGAYGYPPLGFPPPGYPPYGYPPPPGFPGYPGPGGFPGYAPPPGYPPQPGGYPAPPGGYPDGYSYPPGSYPPGPGYPGGPAVGALADGKADRGQSESYSVSYSYTVSGSSSCSRSRSRSGSRSGSRSRSRSRDGSRGRSRGRSRKKRRTSCNRRGRAARRRDRGSRSDSRRAGRNGRDRRENRRASPEGKRRRKGRK